jgi:hypothetical protein
MSLKRNLRFSGTFFFSKDLLLFFTESFFVFVLITFLSSKDLLYFFHIKKVFSFFFNYVFFCPKNLHIFPHKKSFFVIQIFIVPKNLQNSAVKPLRIYICFSFPPFGRGQICFFYGKNLSQNPGACP